MKDIIYSNRESDSDSSDPLKYHSKSILDSFCYIDGRRYHNLSNATYFFPNDEKEAVRLNLQHNIFKFVWKDNFSSPVHELLKSGKAKVLDIGCGTGQWLLDMANDYPQATFVGVDMSPMFPDAKSTPSNVFFLQLNLNDGLPFPNETFDFVTQRCLCNSVAFKQWKFYVKEMIRVTKSSGWLEFFEFDTDYQKASPHFTKVMNSMLSEFLARGINPQPETCVPQFLGGCKELSKLHFKEVNMPTGNWPDQFGAMVKTYITMNADTIKLLISSGWGVNNETYNLIINETKHEFDDKVYIQLFRWYSKKI